MSGYVWLCLDASRCVRMCQDVSDYNVWLCLVLSVVSGCAWLCLVVSGCAWLCLNVSGCVRLCLVVPGCVWMRLVV